MTHIPTRKIADALFRGEKNEHGFKVYPLTGNITDQPAVFIISKRTVDSKGRGHHNAICIGETDSTLNELKKHRRSRCVKDLGANVVCLFKEKDADVRAALIADLVASRKFSCVRNVYAPKIEPIKKRASTKTQKAKPDSKRSASKPSRASSNGAAKAKARTRVQSGVGRDGRQHRLSDPKGISRRNKRKNYSRFSSSQKSCGLMR